MSERNDHLDYLLLSWASAREAEPARLEALAARVCGEARKVEATAAAQEHKTLVLGHKRRAPGEAVDRYLASRGLPWGWQVTGFAAALLIGFGTLFVRHWDALAPLDHRVPQAEELSVLARIGQVQGAVYKVYADPLRVPWQPGAALEPGNNVITVGAGSSVALDYPDLMRLELGADTQLKVAAAPRGSDLTGAAAARSLVLIQGQLRAEVRPLGQEAPVRLFTRHAELRVLGTAFSLAVSDEATRVELEAGRLLVTNRRDGQSVELRAGQTAVVSYTILVADGSGAAAAARAAGGEKAPDTVPGLLLWLRADTLERIGDGTAVALWQDHSGHGRDAAQSAEQKRPVWKSDAANGRPALLFDGQDDSLHGTAPHGFLDSTAFIVFNPYDFDHDAGIWGMARDGENDWRSLNGMSLAEKRDEPGDLHWIRDSLADHMDPRNMSIYVPARAHELVIVTLTLEAGTATFRANGRQLAADSYADRTPLSPTRYALGCRLEAKGETKFNRMALAEVLLYGRALPQAETSGVEQYLSRKHGVALEMDRRAER